MNRLPRLTSISMVLGGAAFLAVVAAHLALIDISHGEADLRLEWTVLRVAFAVIVAAQAVGMYTLMRIRRVSHSDNSFPGLRGDTGAGWTPTTTPEEFS